MKSSFYDSYECLCLLRKDPIEISPFPKDNKEDDVVVACDIVACDIVAYRIR